MRKGINGLLRDKRGISPVVATVILVAVTIVVAVAVAYWMGGIAALYTRYEKIEISSAYATYSSSLNTTGGWTVTINLRNTGSADATITGLLVNGKPWDDASFYVAGTGRYIYGVTYNPSSGSVPSGQTATVTFYVVKGLGFTPGVSIEVKLHSASGQDYPKSVTLD